MKLNLTTALAGVTLALAAGSATAQEIRFMCSGDGVECEVAMRIFERYEAANPGVDVILDKVPYQGLLDTLPIQLAGDTGPDLAFVTDLGGLNPYYLDLAPYVDRKYWEDSYGGTLDWYRVGDDDDGIYGLHTGLTITGAYINRTLFDQAGVAVPSPDADWDTWAAVSREVAEKTGTPFPMAMDRSGHRIAGPAIAYGAKIFDEDGEPILVDEGFKGFVEKFVEWNNDGTMAKDVWGGKGGTAYQDGSKEFINGDLVYYFAGSWQVANFEQQIGDLFDWEVVGSPCGAGGCTGMPGGAGIVGFEQTDHPEIVAELIDLLASEESYAEYSASARTIPTHAAVAAKGVNYEGATPLAAAALNGWAAQVSKLEPIAFAYQGNPNNRAMFNITVQRVTQAVVGELSVDEAMDRMSEDLAAALAESN
ncbi:ABC transporter substrate-binding protein [Celeribacter arenosi]|uniref:sn-glycerol-3-phosphate-binding periplasmic protein UgpB n=1 Tax=Celeribacter arenosi TaxID=792649 RepID=A0ABP7K601_9RHOB